MRASSRIARILYCHKSFVPLCCETKRFRIMTLEKLLLSIIVDDRMGRLNSAIEEVYGVNAVGAVYSEDEELIQYTGYNEIVRQDLVLAFLSSALFLLVRMEYLIHSLIKTIGFIVLLHNLFQPFFGHILKKVRQFCSIYHYAVSLLYVNLLLQCRIASAKRSFIETLRVL